MKRDYFNFIPIFNIHEVGKYVNPWTITSEHFECFLNWMYNQGYTAISIDELCEYYQKNLYPQNKFVLTFDDGRKGVINNALTILEKYNAPAIVYLVYDWVHQFIKDEKECYSEFMNIEDVYKLSNHQITIGYHSKTHCNLTQISKDRIIEETISSRYILEKELGITIEHFSYPYGKINDDIANLLIKHGEYKTIVTSYRKKSNNLYYLPRISLKQYHTEKDFENFFNLLSWD